MIVVVKYRVSWKAAETSILCGGVFTVLFQFHGTVRMLISPSGYRITRQYTLEYVIFHVIAINRRVGWFAPLQ